MEEDYCKSLYLEVVKPHTIKKFELISKYTENWAYKILGYPKSKGLIFIDCMSNSGLYKNNKGEIVQGTPFRVAKILNEIAKNKQKEVILYFNDIDLNKINNLKDRLNEEKLEYIKINYFNKDANLFLKELI